MEKQEKIQKYINENINTDYSYFSEIIVDLDENELNFNNIKCDAETGKDYGYEAEAWASTVTYELQEMFDINLTTYCNY